MSTPSPSWLPEHPNSAPTSELAGDTKDPISEATTGAGAEEIHDPLEGLIERARTNPGAPFEPDVLKSLAALKCDDRARFEVLRKGLKEAGCRVTELDEAIAADDGIGGNGEDGRRDPKQADVLIKLAESAELFHAPDKTGFADLVVNGHRETWPIRSKGFRWWLGRQFLLEEGDAKGHRIQRPCSRQ